MGKKLKHIFIMEASNYNIRNAEELNNELKKKKNFEYMLYMRSFIGKETDIVKKCCALFKREKLRFYACGNFEMVEGIIRGLDSFDNREVAFCPLGNKKGLIENFEENYVNFNIDSLINGEVKCIDYVDAGDICMTNYASVGGLSKLITELKVYKNIIVNSKKDYFSKMKQYLKIARTIIFTKNDKLEIEIDDEKLEDNYTMAHIANGSLLDNDTDQILEDGKLEYILVKKCSLLKRLELVKRILTGKLAPIDNLVYMGNCKKFAINDTKGKNVLMSYDGRVEKRSHLRGNIKNKKVKLVIPQVK
ncbi:MAG: hypothetical protein E7262_04560 [Lachnospiraceae bacterium]|nr:hypothetical protein [Lachnospiraceae bacterium]